MVFSATIDDTWTFPERAENGEIPIDTHERMAHIAYIYLYTARDEAERVFDVVEKLHNRGWSFGQGTLKFNK